jgi:hypothetical protein
LSLQQKVKNTDDLQVKAMEDSFRNDKSARDALVAKQEAAGIFPENTAKFKETLAFLNDKLVKGRQPAERVKVDVTEQGVKNAYERVREAMLNKRVMMEGLEAEVAQQVADIQRAGGQVQKGTNPATGEPAFYRVYKTSFEALDPVRRKLGEAFNGKPVEGFEGLLTEQAKDLYGRIRSIQVEYAGGVDGPQDMLLRNYSEGKDLLNALRIPSGKKIISKDLINPEYFTYDPSGLSREFFSTRKKVQDLMNLTKDPTFVEQQASNHVARVLKDADAKGIKQYIEKNGEWLDLMPNLRARLQNHYSATASAESIVPKTQALSKALKTEVGALPGLRQAEADKIRKEAAKASEEALATGKKEAKQIMAEGKEAAGKIQIPNEKFEAIIGKGDTITQIRKLITEGNTDKLRRASEVIKSDPKVAAAFKEAVKQELSQLDPRAAGSSAIRSEWEAKMKPALLETGLIDDALAKQISERMRVVQLTMEPNQVSQALIFILRQGLAGKIGEIGMGK